MMHMDAGRYVITGEMLRRLRKKQGLTQKELAARAGCCVSTISAIERGVRCMSARQFLTLCRTIGCLPADLLKEL